MDTINRISRNTIVLIVLTGLAKPAFPGQDQSKPADRIVFSGSETARCLKCHGMQNFAFRQMVKDEARLRDLTVIADTFNVSVHRKLTCQSCHAEIREFPHRFAGERPPVSCGSDCHAPDKEGKPYSHASTFAEFRSSVHGKGLTDAASGNPACGYCHGAGNPHGVRPAKNVLPKSIRMGLCVTCHEDGELMRAKHVDPDAVTSYRRSFHYKAIKFGQANTAVCQDCHTVHHILPADSAASSISHANIASTCGQKDCHPGVNMNFAMSGANHLQLRIEKVTLLFLEEKMFVVLTLGTMAMLIVGIVLDIQKKYGFPSLLAQVLRAGGRRKHALRDIGRKIVVFGKKVLID